MRLYEVTQRENSALGGEDIGRVIQCGMDLVDGRGDARVEERGCLRCGLDGAQGQPFGFEVEHAFAKRNIRSRRAAIVGHLRRQQRHRRVRRLVLVAIQVVGHGSLIDKQDGP